MSSPLPSPSVPSPSPSPEETLPVIGIRPIFYLPDPSIGAAWLWFGVAALVTIVCFTLYEFIRKRHSLRRVLYTRVVTNRRECPPIPQKRFGWLQQVWRTPETYYLENVGLDAVMFLRFLKMSLTIVIILICVVIPTLIPINYYSNPQQADGNRSLVNTTNGEIKFGSESLGDYSFANVPHGSNFLWAHLITTYFVSGIVYYFLFTFYRDFVHLASRYIHENDGIMTKRTSQWRKGELVQLRTILVQDIPESLQQDDKLKAWFENLDIGEVETALVDRDAGNSVMKLSKQRERALKKLERAYVRWLVNIDRERRKQAGERVWFYTPGRLLRLHAANIDIADLGLDFHTLEKLRPFRRKTRREKNSGYTYDEIDHFNKKLTDLTVQLKHLRRWGRGRPEMLYNDPNIISSTAAAFVTFKTQRSAQLAVQLLLTTSDNYWTMGVKLAPAVQDVLWENISLPAWRRETQKWGVTLISFVFTFFWILPTSLIAALTSLESLAKVPAFSQAVARIAQSERIYVLITAIGPPLVVNSFNLIVPFILEWLSYRQGWESNSRVERATMSKYFFFLFFNIFFVFTLAQTLSKVVGEFFRNPISIVNLAVLYLPAGASFFINYIILNLMTFAVELLRPGIMIVILFGRWLVKTPRDFHNLSIFSSYINYGMLYPMHVLILIIVICYSSIAPFILLPAAAYFALAWVVYRNQLLYVYVKEWESFGQHGAMAFKRCLTGLGVMQVLMTGLLFGSDATVPGALCVPLIILTIIFHFYCRKVFDKGSYLVPLDRLTTAKKSQSQSGADIASSGNVEESPASSDLQAPPEKGYKGIPKSAVAPSVLAAAATNKSPSSPEVDPKQSLDSNIGSLPASDIVTSAEEQALERYPTKYANPLFSKPLSRPWLPVSIATWWSQLPQMATARRFNKTQAGMTPVIGTSSINPSRTSESSDVSQLNRQESLAPHLVVRMGKSGSAQSRKQYMSLVKPGIDAVATAGAVGLAIGAPQIRGGGTEDNLVVEVDSRGIDQDSVTVPIKEEEEGQDKTLGWANAHLQAASDENGEILPELLPIYKPPVSPTRDESAMDGEEGLGQESEVELEMDEIRVGVDDTDGDECIVPSASESSIARLVQQNK